MKEYKPAEHSETSNVAPLVQFFVLVLIGDTIQSIVQVYFDKELVSRVIFFFFVCTSNNNILFFDSGTSYRYN